jgi:hypothetical protein
MYGASETSWSSGNDTHTVSEVDLDAAGSGTAKGGFILPKARQGLMLPENIGRSSCAHLAGRTLECLARGGPSTSFLALFSLPLHIDEDNGLTDMEDILHV